MSRQPLHTFSLSPRHRRLLRALLAGNLTREQVDRIAGASNGPDEVMRLRRNYGLVIHCTRKGSRDRDGRRVEAGVYQLHPAELERVARLLGEG